MLTMWVIASTLLPWHLEMYLACSTNLFRKIP